MEAVRPKIVFRWIALLFSFLGIPGSDLGSETSYPDLRFPSYQCRDITLHEAKTASFHMLSNHCSLTFLSCDTV
jgi:hypothetical protein